jgi:hypothetical protein
MQKTTQYNGVGLVTILGGLLALASLVTTMMAVHFNSEALANPVLILTLPRVSTPLIKWCMLFDMLGYYLLLLPLIFFLRGQAGGDGLLPKLGSFCGAAYVLIGATGAAILSVLWPSVITAYKTADPQNQLMLAANFRAFTTMVYEGMWNLLEMIFAAAWWVIAGLLFYRKGLTLLGIFTVILGGSCLANAASVVCEINTLHRASLNVYLLLSIVWTLVMGVGILRNRYAALLPNKERPNEKQTSKRISFSTS